MIWNANESFIDGDQVLLAATVIADHPVSPYRDFYFEVTILSEGLNQ